MKRTIAFFLASLTTLSLFAAVCGAPYVGTQRHECSADSDCDKGQKCMDAGLDTKTCEIPCTTPGSQDAPCPQGQECIEQLFCELIPW
jgi:hypothetical protein